MFVGQRHNDNSPADHRAFFNSIFHSGTILSIANKFSILYISLIIWFKRIIMITAFSELSMNSSDYYESISIIGYKPIM